MSKDEYLLEKFYGRLDEYLNKPPFSNSCQFLTFKKHVAHTGPNEISAFIGNNPTNECDDNDLKSALNNVVSSSKNWEIPLSEAAIIDNKLCLRLSRICAFRLVLRAVVSAKGNYGTWTQLTATVHVTADVIDPPKTLTQHRIILLKELTTNILRNVGYNIVETNEKCDLSLEFTGRFGRKSSIVAVECGPVISESGTSVELTLEDYVKQREQDVRAMAEHKYWEHRESDDMYQIAKATVVFELIQVKMNNAVKLNTKSAIVVRREESSKGAPFILYNMARISTILKKFENGVAQGIYPPTPSEIDYSLLNEEEEWYLLFDFLLEYPSLLRRTVVKVESGQIGNHMLCAFLLKLSQIFSVYYRRVRILPAEAKPHLLPTMFARLHLITAIEYVMDHALSILNINKLDHM